MWGGSMGLRGFIVVKLHERLEHEELWELTKRYEEVIRGHLGALELPELRGEVTVVVEGCGDTEAGQEGREIGDELLDAVLARGEPLSKAARELARATGIPRQQAYRLLLTRSKR